MRLRTNRRDILFGLALFAGVMIVFGPCCAYGFFNFDDASYVAINPHVKRGLNRSDFAWAWTTLHCSNWHPLTWLSFQIDSQLFGTSRGVSI